jgi:hypothetical protein
MNARVAPIRIRDVKHGKDGLLVQGRVTYKGPLDGRSQWTPHALARIADDTGEILVNLWREQIEQVQVGDEVSLQNAFARNFRGKLVLSMYGSIEKTQKPRKKQ